MGTTSRKPPETALAKSADQEAPKTRVLGADAPREIEPGQWYWYQDQEDEEELERRYGKKRRKKLEVARLTCVTAVGSNYIKLRFVDSKWESTIRVHIDEFDDVCAFESNPTVFIRSMINRHQEDARQLLAEVQRVTALLGIRPYGLLEEQTATDSTSRALVVAHGTDNIHDHKAALVKAKETTLPDLFKQIEEAHEKVAIWMKAELVPMKVQAAQLRGAISIIEDRIFTVELYAGLVEELVKVREGKPADVTTKVALYQRRHYMDEECLARYEHGGMTFENIDDFDEWIARPDNFTRLLPSDRCIVAFRVRRYNKDRGPATSFAQLLQFWYEQQADRQTYLYIRNGEQLFRMSTGIDFGRRLFPDTEHSVLLGSRDKLYAREFAGKVDEVISERQYQGMIEDNAKEKKRYRQKLREWKKLSAKEKKERHFKPYFSPIHRLEDYFEVSPEHVYYDDVMKKIAKEAKRHNRVVVVLQGLLDRSPALHPHPPWQIWTAEGFAQGIELVYDDSRALAPAEKPDFEAFRAKLNATLKRGCMTIGQYRQWVRHETAKEIRRRQNSWRYKREDYEYLERHGYTPYGNDGPDEIAEVKAMGKKGCTFEWERERVGSKIKWIPNPDRPGWLMADRSKIPCRFTCPTEKLLNVSAYQAGDFRQFFDDPRTRRDYLKWAPILLKCEEYANRDKPKPKKKRKRKKRSKKS